MELVGGSTVEQVKQLERTLSEPGGPFREHPRAFIALACVYLVAGTVLVPRTSSMPLRKWSAVCRYPFTYDANACHSHVFELAAKFGMLHCYFRFTYFIFKLTKPTKSEDAMHVFDAIFTTLPILSFLATHNILIAGWKEYQRSPTRQPHSWTDRCQMQTALAKAVAISTVCFILYVNTADPRTPDGMRLLCALLGTVGQVGVFCHLTNEYLDIADVWKLRRRDTPDHRLHQASAMPLMCLWWKHPQVCETWASIVGSHPTDDQPSELSRHAPRVLKLLSITSQAYRCTDAILLQRWLLIVQAFVSSFAFMLPAAFRRHYVPSQLLFFGAELLGLTLPLLLAHVGFGDGLTQLWRQPRMVENAREREERLALLDSAIVVAERRAESASTLMFMRLSVPEVQTRPPSYMPEPNSPEDLAIARRRVLPHATSDAQGVNITYADVQAYRSRVRREHEIGARVDAEAADANAAVVHARAAAVAAQQTEARGTTMMANLARHLMTQQQTNGTASSPPLSEHVAAKAA